MEDKGDSKCLAAEISLLRVIWSMDDRLLKNVDNNHMLKVAALRNCLLRPEVEPTPEVMKGSKDALRLVKLTVTGTLGGATVLPSTDGHPAHRAFRLASP